MRHARLRFWCDLTIWPLVALACLALWLLFVTRAAAAEATREDEPSPVTVWRFYNAEPGARFYTADAVERTRILATHPQFVDEGVRFHAYTADAIDRVPVHRFYNTRIGQTSIPLALPGDGGNGLSGDYESEAGRIRYAALQKILTVDREPILVAKAADVMDLALKSAKAINDAVGTVPAAVQSAFSGNYTDLAAQLARVATLIAARDVLGVNRHIFFWSMAG